MRQQFIKNLNLLGNPFKANPKAITAANYLTRLWLASCLISLPIRAAHANPQDGVVAAGSSTITSNGNTLDINQHTDKTVIDWRSFNIAPDETTNFHQPSSGSIALNRINGGDPSQIMGKLSANGNVIIVNPSGVVFGQGSRVDANGLIATTANVTNENFMAGRLKFDQPGNANAAIVNDGQITVKDAGLVGLVAPNVINNGVINARLGRVQLASGDTVTADFYGDGLLEVAVSDAVKNQLVANTGTINAAGGQIALTAAAGKNIVNSLIQVDGELNAQSIATKNGKIFIYAEGSNAVKNNTSTAKNQKTGSSKVIIAGKLNAAGNHANEKGGTIDVLADNIDIKNTATITAAGSTGGGTIRLGGDMQGKGTTPTARNTNVAAGAKINADAIDTGNGGKVTVWADNQTRFNGNISARGGNLSGDGGFAEVSGKTWLDYRGFTDLRAAHGLIGMLLLDPNDITISNAADSTGTTSNINVGTLQSQLAGSYVTIQTSAGSGGNGDISFLAPITWASNTSLTLYADRDIIFGASVTNTGSGNGGIYANAYRNITVNPGVNLQSGTTGDMVLNAANNSSYGTGLLTLNGTLTTGTGTLHLTSGHDGANNRPNQTFTSSNLILPGTVSGIDIQGFGNLEIQPDLVSNGNVYIGNSTNITMGNVSTSGNYLQVTANDNLAIGNVTGGTNGYVTICASNCSAFDTGVLTLNGNILAGSGGLRIISGYDNSYVRPDYTFTSSNLTFHSTAGSIDIEGFNNLTIQPNLSATDNVFIGNTNNITAGNITTSGNYLQVFANKDLTIGAATAGSTGTLELCAAGCNQASAGLLTLTGNIAAGSGYFKIISGYGVSTRPDYTFTSSNLTFAGTAAAIEFGGFNNLAIQRDLTSAHSITINANSVSAQNLTAGENISVNAKYDITVGNAFTGTGGYLSLSAADGNENGLGTLTLNGNLKVGTGLNLISGYDNSNNRLNYTFNTTKLAFTGAGGNVKASGFGTLNFDQNINANGIVYLSADDLAVRNVSSGIGSYIILAGNNSFGLLGSAGTTVTFNSNTNSLGIYGPVNAGNHNLTLIGDNISIGTSVISANSGTGRTLTIRPYSTNKSFGIGDGATCGGSCDLSFSNYFALDRILDGWNSIVFGSLSNTGVMDIRAKTWSDPVTYLNGGNITLNGAVTSTAGTGSVITLATGGNFINNVGALGLNPGSGRWLVYSTKPANNTFNSLAGSFRRFSCTYGGTCPSFTSETGNGYLYSDTPMLTVTPDITAASITYGDAAPTFSGYNYTLSGYLGTDANNDGVSGTLNGGSNYTQYGNAGTYNITYGSGTLTSTMGYGFTYAGITNGLTVLKKTITAAFNSTLTKIYGSANPSIDYSNFTFTGLVNSDSAGLFSSVTPNFGSITANSNVSSGNAVSAAIGDTANYTVSNTPSTTLSITPKALTIATAAQTKTYGDADPTFTGSATGLTAYDISQGVSFAYAPTSYSGHAGTYAIGATATDANSRLGNYTITNNYSNLVVSKRTLTATIADKSRAYGDANPAYSGSDVTFGNFASGDNASVINTLTFATAGTATATANAGTTHAVTINSFADNDYDLGTTTNGVLSIVKRNITAAFNSTLTKIYGSANPTIDYNNFTFTGLVNSDAANLFTSITPNLGGAGVNSNVGSYSVSAAIGDTTNYTIATAPTTTLSITPKNLTVTTDSQAKNYSDADPAFTGNTSGLTTYDIAQGVAFTYAPQGYSGNAGSYTIAGNATDPNNRLGNYTRVNSYGNLVVTGAPPAPTPSPTVNANIISQLPATFFTVSQTAANFMSNLISTIEIKTDLFQISPAVNDDTLEISQSKKPYNEDITLMPSS